MHRFLIVIENAGENFSAYSPDLPGCVATGELRDPRRNRTTDVRGNPVARRRPP